MRFIQLLVLILLVVLVPAQRVLADDDEVSEDASGNLPTGYVRSGNALNSGGHTEADSLSLQAEYATQHGYYDQAINLCQQAIKKDDDDSDIHLAYADAMEHKLRRQKDKDPNLYMATVREWLIVLRNEKGDERGLTSKNGLALPGMQHLYADEERSIPALHHIVSLVGYPPKMTESDQKYMHKVAKQCENMVKGRVVQKASVVDASSQPIANDRMDSKNRSSGQAGAAQSKSPASI